MTFMLCSELSRWQIWFTVAAWIIDGCSARRINETAGWILL